MLVEVDSTADVPGLYDITRGSRQFGTRTAGAFLSFSGSFDAYSIFVLGE